jgi:hypothetical protein
MRIEAVVLQYVDQMPERLAPGVLYVSRRYALAMHCCCCGCGEDVVTPLSPAKWRVTEQRSGVSLYPSVGNWGLPCRSHYWIRNGEVLWARDLSEAEVDRVRRRDRADEAAYMESRERADSTRK